MEFGRANNLDGVDWALPPLHPHNPLWSSKQPVSQTLPIRLGLPVWGEPGFVGTLYPSTAREKDYLMHYAAQFDTIELNATHYRVPDSQRIAQWCAMTPDGFEFCCKLPKDVSHRLQPDWVALDYFCSALRLFGTKAGPSFVQYSEHADRQWRRPLFELLNRWPADLPLFVELRHPSWFDDAELFLKLCDYLHQRGVGLVLTDTSGRRDVLHMAAPNGQLMLRFLANNGHPTDRPRLDAWTQRLGQWHGEAGLKAAHLFVHSPNQVHSIPLADAWLPSLGNLRGSAMKPIWRYDQHTIGAASS